MIVFKSDNDFNTLFQRVLKLTFITPFYTIAKIQYVESILFSRTYKISCISKFVLQNIRKYCRPERDWEKIESM